MTRQFEAPCLIQYTRSHCDEQNSIVVVKLSYVVSSMRIAIVGSGVSGISALWVSWVGLTVTKLILSC